MSLPWKAEAEVRLEAVALTVRTIKHQLGNKLAVTVGYSEMLAEDPRLPPDLQAHAQQALTSAMAAADVVHRLDTELVRVEIDASTAGPPVLDITASTQASSR